MFERFTEQAREAIVHAQEEARAAGHHHIGTEHLLLGLLGVQDGTAARALAPLGVGHDDVRAQVVRIVGSGEETAGGAVPFTPRAKKVLELSLREALRHGHRDIDTEHLLLGLVAEGTGVGSRILLEAGAGADEVRAAVATARGQRSVTARQGSPQAFAGWLGRLLTDAAAHAQGSGGPDGGDLLLALARDQDGVAARAFAHLDVTQDTLRAAIRRARERSD